MKRQRRGEFRSVSVQIRVRVKKPAKIKLTKAFLADAVQYRIDNGEDLPGIEITGVVWENPAKTYEYEGDRIDGALHAIARIMEIRPGVFRPVRED